MRLIEVSGGLDMWSISTAYPYPHNESVLKAEARRGSRREQSDEGKARRGKQNQQQQEPFESSLEIDPFEHTEPEP